MDMIWIGVGVSAALAIAAYVLVRRPPRSAPAPRRPASASGRAAAPAVPVAGEATRPPPAPRPPAVAEAPPDTAVPAVLEQCRIIDAQQLGADRRKGYIDVFGKVPRPPRLLQHLLSPSLFNAASSAELVDLISADPLIAAQVLATVNSAVYGLPRKVTSIGQAVTYLGLNSVRILGLRYLMRATFRADSAERRERLEELWQASAVATELAQRLSAPLGADSRGLLVSAVLLSFLGRLTVAATTPRALLAELPRHDPFERLQAEQAKLGLSAGQIGRLLMQEWGLPAPVVDCAAAIDTVPLQAASRFAPDTGALLALAYVSVRLGERLAFGELPDLLAVQLRTDPAPEWHHWRGHLQHPALASLPEQLHAADLDAALKRHLGAQQPEAATV